MYESLGTIVGIVLGIATIASILVGFALKQVKASNEKSTIFINSVKDNINSSLTDHRREFKEEMKDFKDSVDKQFDRVNIQLGTTSTELKELIYRETAALKVKNSEQDTAIISLKDKVHHINEEHLKFQLVVSEQYQKKT